MAQTQSREDGLTVRLAARTKLMMKFWAAMHKAGIPEDREWDAQEKIKIKDLAKLLRRP